MGRGANSNYLLGVLTVIYLSNGLDRAVLGVVLSSIKAELHLSDTQLGVLTGIAFALFYSVMGVPIARWADRGDRVNIISLCVLVWSAAVAASAAVTSFAQLLLIRVVVAVGEAGCIPTSHSLLADFFDRAERPRAAAIFGIGGPLSAVLGFFLAGWLNELYGWRMTFVLLGVPGVLLAAIAWLTLKEPRRNRAVCAAAARPDHAQPSLKEVCVALWGNATFRQLLLCLSVIFLFIWGIFVWLPTFFIRSFDLSTGQVGTGLALTFGLGGVIGSYLGGALSSRYVANREHLQLKLMAIMVACAGLLSFFAYLSTNVLTAFAFVGLSSVAITTPNGPLFATVQTLVPERMRAVAMAIVYMSANLIGMGLGPLTAGALSDAMHAWSGEESLRYALLMLSPGYFWAAWHAWRASKSVTRDLAAAHLDRARAAASESMSPATTAQ